MDWSVIWPGVRSSSQSKHEWVAEGPGLLEELQHTPCTVGETSFVHKHIRKRKIHIMQRRTHCLWERRVIKLSQQSALPKFWLALLAGELGELYGETLTMKPIVITKKYKRTRCRSFWLVSPTLFYQDEKKLWTHYYEKRVGFCQK